MPKKKGKGKGKSEDAEDAAPSAEAIKITIDFKRYMYDPKKQMIQS